MQNKSTFSWELFQTAPVIGIMRGLSEDTIRKLAEAFFNAGFTTLEVTMNTKGAVDILKLLNQLYPGMNIGAGTVCTLKDLESAINAGAQFIVTPIFDAAVIQEAVQLQIPIFPGAYTPTEIYKAHSLGATAVKVFPANQLGPSYIKNVLAPLDDLQLIPTGGVSIENIDDYFKAGAIGVGMGSSLFKDQLTKVGDAEGSHNHLRKLKSKIKDYCK